MDDDNGERIVGYLGLAIVLGITLGCFLALQGG